MTAPRRLQISAYAALSQAVTAVNIAFEDRCTSRRLPKKNIWRLFPSLPALSGLMGAGFIVGSRHKRLCEQTDEDATEQIMEQLSNPRWELFAQLIAAGRSATAAYAQAYGRGRDTASRVNGRRLLTNAYIQERISEIRREAAAASASTLQKVIEELGRSAVEKIRHGSFKQACDTARSFADMVINLADGVEGKGTDIEYQRKEESRRRHTARRHPRPQCEGQLRGHAGGHRAQSVRLRPDERFCDQAPGET